MSSDPISRTPVVGPTFPVRPVQPASRNDDDKRRGGRPPRKDDAAEQNGTPENGTDGHSPTIDEYI